MRNYLLLCLCIYFNLASYAQTNTLPGTGNVGINTTSPQYNLDVNGTTNTSNLLINRQLVFAMPTNDNPEKGFFNPLFPGLRTGRRLHWDEQFDTSLNGIIVYNNVNNGNVTINRKQLANLPNTSGFCLEIKGTSPASPQQGGYYQGFNMKLNKTYVHVFRAKVPIGYTVTNNSNSFGTGGSRYWITSTAGTGKWEEYAYVVSTGNSGVVATGGHVYLSGPTPTVDNPLVWHVASSSVFDVTSTGDDLIRNQASADQIGNVRISGNGFFGGNIGVGTVDTKEYKLGVNGAAIFGKAVVRNYGSWPDYVFEENYKLPPLSEIESYVKREKHLPGLASAKEIERDGMDILSTNKALTELVEQMTLRLIEMDKSLQALKEKVKALEAERE